MLWFETMCDWIWRIVCGCFMALRMTLGAILLVVVGGSILFETIAGFVGICYMYVIAIYVLIKELIALIGNLF